MYQVLVRAKLRNSRHNQFLPMFINKVYQSISHIIDVSINSPNYFLSSFFYSSDTLLSQKP